MISHILKKAVAIIKQLAADPRIGFYLFVGLLIIIGLAQCIIRHQVYGVPWTPHENRKIWDVEARVKFEGSGDPVKISMAAPRSQEGFTLFSYTSSSPGYGLSYLNSENQDRAEWTIRRASGVQTIYFKAQFLVDKNADYEVTPPAATEKPIFKGAEKKAVTAIVRGVHFRSSDHLSFARELIKAINDEGNQNTALILKNVSKSQALATLMSYADVPSRLVGVINLEDGRRRQALTQMVQVWDGKKWQLFSPDSISPEQRENLLIWDESNVSLLDVVGGKNSNVYFSMISRDVSPKLATAHKASSEGLLNFSIHSLPLGEQTMFKTILLIPIGALLVVFLRIIIGLKTSGTFMPILIAVTFVQTQLLTGIIGFLLIVGTGLLIRSYLSKLNLLLVARISAVIIAVIMIISFFTVIAYKIGLTEGLTITFFPMIILAWTIERMSILWEEDGPKAVLAQGGGSLLTAVLVYAVMTNAFVRHVTFNFIGIQLVILGIVLLLGSYTGYRLTELKRFKPLAED